jgi:hypothetical protein
MIRSDGMREHQHWFASFAFKPIKNAVFLDGYEWQDIAPY